ncbi:MAG: AhpC/TSA family protein [Bacteroidaceae bacterium]|nr:AhpC/TSA family protein [Bacteroidaceae bacterium]
MKRTVIMALLLIGTAVAAFAQSGNIAIKGKVDGIKKGRLYLLARSSAENTDTIGSCSFKKGKFNLKATATEPLFAQLVVEGFSGGFTFFVEPGAAYTACLSEGDNFYIKGGELNEEYAAHMNASDSLRMVITALQESYDSLRMARKFRSASLVNDTLRREQENLRAFTNGFLAANDNVITAYTVYSNVVMRESGLKEARRMYNTLGEGARASQYGRMLKEHVNLLAKTDKGAKAPDFTLANANGDNVTMSTVKGKIKIIDFWASWCGPCRLNNPALKKLYEEFHPKGLEIIGVSLDTDKAAWEKAIEKDGLTWFNVSSLKGWDCDVVRLYNVKGVPSLFILDEYNNIMATGLRGEQLRAFLEENLGK